MCAGCAVGQDEDLHPGRSRVLLLGLGHRPRPPCRGRPPLMVIGDANRAVIRPAGHDAGDERLRGAAAFREVLDGIRRRRRLLSSAGRIVPHVIDGDRRTGSLHRERADQSESVFRPPPRPPRRRPATARRDTRRRREHRRWSGEVYSTLRLGTRFMVTVRSAEGLSPHDCRGRLAAGATCRYCHLDSVRHLSPAAMASPPGGTSDTDLPSAASFGGSCASRSSARALRLARRRRDGSGPGPFAELADPRAAHRELSAPLTRTALEVPLQSRGDGAATRPAEPDSSSPPASSNSASWWSLRPLGKGLALAAEPALGPRSRCSGSDRWAP